MLDAQRGAHHRAQAFCRTVLRCTGRQDQQVGVAGLYRQYCALERRARVQPLRRHAFLQALSAAFPAAHITPRRTGTPRLVVGVQAAHTSLGASRLH